MTLETLDIAYSEVKNVCLNIMSRESMPFMAMDYVVSKVLADFQNQHIIELTRMSKTVPQEEALEAEE